MSCQYITSPWMHDRPFVVIGYVELMSLPVKVPIYFNYFGILEVNVSVFIAVI